MDADNEQPDRALDPVRDNVSPNQQPLQPGRVRGRRTARGWRDALGPVSERLASAEGRLLDMHMTLYRLYTQRPLSDPSYSQPRLQNEIDRQDPDYIGPIIDDDFPENFDTGEDPNLAEIGRFIAAMGGYLELRAIFPDESELLLQEPGPEHLHDGAS